MHRVYTRETPANQKVAVISAASLLALTLLTAQLLVSTKHRQWDAPLGPRLAISDAGLSLEAPEGWTRGDLENDDGMIMAVFREPADQAHNAGPRELIIARGDALEGKFPLVALANVLPAVGMKRVRKIIDAQVHQKGAAPLGPLPAASGVIAGIGPDRGPVFLYGRVGVAPSGVPYGLVLQSAVPPGSGGAHDRRLLDKIAATVRIDDLRTTEDGTALIAKTGLTFDPPPGARFVMNADHDDVGRLVLYGDPADPRYWTLEAFPIWLAPGRDVRGLLEGFVGDLSAEPEPSRLIEVLESNGRPAFQARISAGSSHGLRAWAVGLDDKSAVLMLGRYEGLGEQALLDAASRIAATLGHREGATPIDLEAALRRGIDVVRRIETTGLSEWLAWEADQVQYYLIERNGRVEGYVTALVRGPQSNAGEGWELKYHIQHDRRLENPQGRSQEWWMSEDARRHEGSITWSGEATAPRYSEQRSTEASETETVERELIRGDRRKRWSTPIQPGYAQEAAERIAEFLVASDGRSGRVTGPAMVWTTTMFDPGLASVLIRPEKVAAPQGPDQIDSKVTYVAAVVQSDHSPWPYRVLFDPHGRLMRLESGPDEIIRACTQQEWAEHYSARSRMFLTPFH